MPDSNSTAPPLSDKPVKPGKRYPDFLSFAHAVGVRADLDAEYF